MFLYFVYFRQFWHIQEKNNGLLLKAAHEQLPLLLEDTNTESVVEDFSSVVRGGSSESISALASKNVPTPDLMRLWGDGVHYNPELIRSTVGRGGALCLSLSHSFTHKLTHLHKVFDLRSFR